MGNIRSGGGVPYRGSELNYDDIIQDLKYCLKSGLGSFPSSKYVTHIRILHEMSTKNFSNVKSLDMVMLKDTIDRDTFTKLKHITANY